MDYGGKRCINFQEMITYYIVWTVLNFTNIIPKDKLEILPSMEFRGIIQEWHARMSIYNVLYQIVKILPYNVGSGSLGQDPQELRGLVMTMGVQVLVHL